MDRTKLLIKRGFTKGLYKSGILNEGMLDKYYEREKNGSVKLKAGIDIKAEGLKADEEEAELFPGKFGITGFPAPLKRYRLSWEMYDLSLEEPYFWILDTLKMSLPEIEKVEDTFAAAENSAFFGVSQTRLGAQQDKVSQFLATTGKMIKELFQMVRELRIIDERIQYYREAEEQTSKPLSERGKSAEITLKGLFVDLVQGGAKSAASVFGMSRELEFITLPDIFFDAPPFKNAEEMEGYVGTLRANFNENVVRVLSRHLRQFLEWKKRTHKEHESRKRFMLQYLRQHFDIIKMYINWVKPYLRHVERLTLKEGNMASPDIVSAFEGSMLDIELIAKEKKEIRVGDEVVAVGYDCVLATFNYRTRPEMKVVQEGYNRGPVHVGKFEVNLRVYGWLAEELENYKKMKEDETKELMGDVSASVKEAMESLGEELEHYLEEAKGEVKKDESSAGKSTEQKTLFERMFGDFYTPQKKIGSKKSSKRRNPAEVAEAIKNFRKVPGARAIAWNTYHNFKKSHRMIAW